MIKYPLLLLPFLFLSGCNNDINNFDLEKDPLKGVLAGDEWIYTAGSSNFNDFTNSVDGLLIDFEINDPCSVVATTANYIQVSVPARVGNYTLSVSQNTSVIFHLQRGIQYTVTAGFVDVVKFNGNILIGYLNADLDDNNKVKGSFFLTICN